MEQNRHVLGEKEINAIIDEIKNFMRANGAARAMMSGSGPTVFGIYKDQAQAADAYMKLKETDLAKDIFVTTFVSPLMED